MGVTCEQKAERAAATMRRLRRVVHTASDYSAERLRGFRLEVGRYVPIELKESRIHSEQIGPDLVVDGEFMRLFDPKTNRFPPTRTEAEAERQAETARAAAAEAEIARLRAEIASLRGS